MKKLLLLLSLLISSVITLYAQNDTSQPSNKTFTANGVSFTMVYVEGGTFTMGITEDEEEYDDENSQPAHSVTLSSYMIGQTEVTQELWQAVMGSNPSKYQGNIRRPVECVTWKECQDFIKKLNELTGQKFRLPTEAEWEFAARGGTKSKGYKFSGGNDISDVAWTWQNSGIIFYVKPYENYDFYDFENNHCKPHAVATKAPNELGIYDMSGNVWEWCQDWYGDYNDEAQTNPTGPSSGENRVTRGGAWCNNYDFCTPTFRQDFDMPESDDNVQGLRLAL